MKPATTQNHLIVDHSSGFKLDGWRTSGLPDDELAIESGTAKAAMAMPIRSPANKNNSTSLSSGRKKSKYWPARITSHRPINTVFHKTGTFLYANAERTSNHAKNIRYPALMSHMSCSTVEKKRIHTAMPITNNGIPIHEYFRFVSSTVCCWVITCFLPHLRFVFNRYR